MAEQKKNEKRKKSDKLNKLAQSVGAVHSLKDIADMAGVSTKTVERWIKKGLFPQADLKFTRKTHRWRDATVREAIDRIIRTTAAA